MAERAHPDLPGFRNKWKVNLRRGIVPWISKEINPYREEFYWRYRWVAQYCMNRDVLDIPCGMGWGTSLLKGCSTLIGVDIDNDSISDANHRYGKKAKFLVGSMSELEFDDSSFDVVVCLEGIEHVEQEVGQIFISEAARVLRPGGMLFLSSPHCSQEEHSGNPYHIREYRPEELREMIEQHLSIEDEIVRDVDNLTISYFHSKLRS